jgi:hypothetical protein
MSQNQGTRIEVHGDVTGSAINLGEISGNVSGIVNQLPESSDPSQPGIRELLNQLQKAVEEEDNLSPEDKADLLEQVKFLAEAKQESKQDKKESLARKARKIFDSTLKALPDTAKLIDASSKLIPLILKSLGISI